MNQREQFEKWWEERRAAGHPPPEPHEIWQAAQAAAVQWQPIETAPNEGKELIIVWVPAMGHGLMKWNGIWDDRIYNCDGPTHWMPLPAAPKPTEDGK